MIGTDGDRWGGGVHLKDTALVARAGARVMNRTARGLVVLD